MKVIGYFSGDGSTLTASQARHMTHIIYSFLHIDKNGLAATSSKDSLAIDRLLGLKKFNPKLKIILSLGGWGGCPVCSDVFSTPQSREKFVHSVVHLLKHFNADGFDLDWEYPAIASDPATTFKPVDKFNFTLLTQSLRQEFGRTYELSFAAGGFSTALSQCFEWQLVMPLVDNVNLMTYDLVNGYSKLTGHVSPLYSTVEQPESTDHAVKYLDSIGVDPQKIAIGMVFYARLFKNVPPGNTGLYQEGKFSNYMAYYDFDRHLSAKAGYIMQWDNIAKAPYAYNRNTHTYATFDNSQSIIEKVRYVHEHKLGGIMFWELLDDKEPNGLLDVINKAKKEFEK